MGFIKVASIKDIGPVAMKGFKAGGKDILFVNLKGKYFGLDNSCTHMGCDLSEGSLQGESVECPCHGSIFDIKTGKVLKGPAKKAAAVFKVKIEGGDLLVDV